ncbi:MAG: hypothetical protein LQ337_007246 [Flavoplaca oasis]|nr:MAG: hypothetical protein LQ337_007246 [Flavoplaca oasis]
MDIVDSHVHLYPGAEAESLAWCTEGHPLYSQHSVEDYLEATKDLKTVYSHKLRGFIFVETDRKSHTETETGWKEPLRELEWIRRVVDGKPRSGEGHTSQHAQLCLGVVLWGPLPSGPDVMQRYLNRVQGRAGSMFSLVNGFRYLVQDKPRGTMLDGNFIASLRWMGQSGFAFDLGIDTRSGGIWQLEEAAAMIEKAHDGVPDYQKVKIVISKIRDYNGNPAREPFASWKTQLTRLASFSNVYMKVSGAFSEMDPLPPEDEQGKWRSEVRDDLVGRTRSWSGNWLKEVFSIFGPQRILWGSDWPVLNLGGGGNRASWMNWWAVVDGFVKDDLNGEDQARFWSDNALEAYGCTR